LGGVFAVDKKLTGQYVSIMAHAAIVEVISEKRSGKKTRRMVMAGIAALLACGAATAWGVYSLGYESTDDAQIDAHLNVVSSRIAGTTAAVYVTDNQAVEAGQALADLDPSEQKIAYAQAKAQYDQAVAQLNAQRPSVEITRADNAASAVTADAQVAQAKAAVAAASQDLASAAAKLVEAQAVETRDEADLKRYEQLFQAGTISRQDYERSVAAARSADANATAATANVASAEKLVEQRKADIDAQGARREQISITAPRQVSIRQADLENAQANVEAAAAQLQRAALNLSFCHIVAPVRGIVTQRSAEIGNRVSEAQPLMMIVATGDTWITANFKETQLARMRDGQRVKVHVDALKKDLEGTVEGIPAITGARSSVLPPENATGNYIKVVQRMPVRVRLNAGQDGVERLRPGMSVEATVWLR
jgi:membrane fusion protein (multidrug efflux system)